VVEGVAARRVTDVSDVENVLKAGEIPVLVDPDTACLQTLRPEVLVEATLSKQNTGIHQDMAPLVIALGPGFTAGVDAHMVVETKRGHDLGRIITHGQAEPNTGVPGNIAGESLRRVLRAPSDGEFRTDLDIGDRVASGQSVARVADLPVTAQIGGLLRGLIRPGSHVTRGLKVGDVDPRDDPSYVDTISEKARAVGGAVLEAIMRVYNR
jgi:xanthine dehydrogenase accessory factor